MTGEPLHEKHKDHIVIYKLRHNVSLTITDYKSLKHILTGELGFKEDYEREYKDTSFGLVERKIAKMEYEAFF